MDTLDRKVADEFIEKIYQPYYDKYKDTFCGFFCDEPQISRNGIPWNLTLPEAYKKEYGEDILEKLDELFFPNGNYEDIRVKFWRLITIMFSENFMKPVYEWCLVLQNFVSILKVIPWKDFVSEIILLQCIISNRGGMSINILTKPCQG